ncbi:MoxR family ATPase [Odoribacter sp. Z80]|nr:MoxR family ATPase [Odoribacter sp. Z80]
MSHMEGNFEIRIDFTVLNEKIRLLREQMTKVIIGQEKVLDLLLTALLADGHVLIEGVPGVAKTLMARVLSRLIDAGFGRIQFTPDLMPSDILGTSVFLPASGKFEFRKGPVFTNILLVDEINRSPAKTQAALFEVMEERQITNDGVMYPMSFPFVVVATQNPVEHEGTYRLPEAQLDRFMFKVLVDYPGREEEIEVLKLHDSGSVEEQRKLEAVLSVEELKYLRDKVKEVRVDEKMKAFIVDIVATTRHNGWLYLGASPRASIALMNSAKAYAALNGRDFVVPEDVLYLAVPVLRHRVQLSAEKELEGIVVDQALQQLIAKVEIPR